MQIVNTRIMRTVQGLAMPLGMWLCYRVMEYRRYHLVKLIHLPWNSRSWRCVELRVVLVVGIKLTVD